MELKGMTMPGYRVNEYSLVLNPHPDLQEKIKNLRVDFDKAFHIKTKIGGRPNVGLVNWMQYEMYESRLADKLKLVAMAYPPFKIELRNFGSYPPHTIYIDMVSHLGIQNLIKEIRENAQKLMKLNPETKPYFLQEPHITVGRKLLPWQYEKAWLEYSQKHFRGSFIADAMLLLKRAQGEKSWQIAERFDFQNLPVNTAAKQGELF